MLASTVIARARDRQLGRLFDRLQNAALALLALGTVAVVVFALRGPDVPETSGPVAVSDQMSEGAEKPLGCT